MNHLHRRGLVAAAVLAAAGLTTGPTGLRSWSAAVLTAYLILTVVVLLAGRRVAGNPTIEAALRGHPRGTGNSRLEVRR